MLPFNFSGAVRAVLSLLCAIVLVAFGGLAHAGPGSRSGGFGGGGRIGSGGGSFRSSSSSPSFTRSSTPSFTSSRSTSYSRPVTISRPSSTYGGRSTTVVFQNTRPAYGGNFYVYDSRPWYAPGYFYYAPLYSPTGAIVQAGGFNWFGFWLTIALSLGLVWFVIWINGTQPKRRYRPF